VERREVLMKNRIIVPIAMLVVFIFLSADIAANQSAQGTSSDTKETEVFQARLLPGPGPSSQQAEKLKILVHGYTSKDEVLHLMDVHHKRGYEPFRATFRGMNKGEIQPIGGRGSKLILHAAQSIQTEKGREIILVTESYSWDIGTRFNFDQRYPFTVIELDINNKGKGNGKVYLSAQIKLSSEGVIELESYSSPPKPLWGVSAKK
jgi:hypothetical protein